MKMDNEARRKALERQREIADWNAMSESERQEYLRREREKQKRQELLLQRKRQQQKTERMILMAGAVLVLVIFLFLLQRFSGCSPDREPETVTAVQTAEETKSTEAETKAAAEQTAPSETVPVQTVPPEPTTTLSMIEIPPVTAPSTVAPSSAVNVSAVGTVVDPSGIIIPEWITVDLIHVNPVSRPAIALETVNDIAIHYVGNAGSSAKANRDYFDSLDNPAVEGAGRQASAHLIVGLNGEVVQCLPLNEMAYAVRSRNPDTISIEVCHPDETGKFSDVTYQTVVKLTAWLLQQKGMTPDHVIRHHDCDGKACPVYYVEHPEAWEQLKQDIAAYYYAHPNIQ